LAGKSQTKLTESDVIQIKTLIEEGNVKINDIAELFNVKPATVSAIKSGRIWSHVQRIDTNSNPSGMIVYKLTNPNGKCYVASTILPIDVRMYHHDMMNDWRYNHLPLYVDIAESGLDSFTIEIIDRANTVRELTLKETYWIQFNDAIASGYNTHLPIHITSLKTLKRLIGLEVKKYEDKQAALNYKPQNNENMSRGTTHHNSKLSEDDVIQIKLLLKEGVVTGRDIAKQFEVATSAISKIKSGKAWAHVTI